MIPHIKDINLYKNINNNSNIFINYMIKNIDINNILHIFSFKMPIIIVKINKIRVLVNCLFLYKLNYFVK